MELLLGTRISIKDKGGMERNYPSYPSEAGRWSIMAVITAPLMIFVLGIVASFYLLIRSRDSPGEEGTIGS